SDLYRGFDRIRRPRTQRKNQGIGSPANNVRSINAVRRRGLVQQWLRSEKDSTLQRFEVPRKRRSAQMSETTLTHENLDFVPKPLFHCPGFFTDSSTASTSKTPRIFSTARYVLWFVDPWLSFSSG